MKACTRIHSLLALTLAALPLMVGAAETAAPQASTDVRKENLPALIKEAEKGVFFIRVLDTAGKPISMGTGFLVDAKGSVLTSLHVVRPSTAEASSAEVMGVDGKVHAVKGVTVSDESLDLALLQLESPPEGGVPLTLGGDHPPERGDYVLVLGHPQGFRFVSTDGIVSGVDKTRDLPQNFRDSDCVRTGPDVVWLQTSAAVAPGNSGGPMLDSAGKAIGVIQWMARGSGLNFALHIAPAKALLARPHKLVSVEEFARPEAELRKIVAKFKADYPRYLNFNPTFSEKRGMQPNNPSPPMHPAEVCVPELLALAGANAGNDLEYRALETLLMIACGRGCPESVADDVRKAATKLLTNYSGERRILSLVRNRPAPTLSAARDFLRGLVEKSSDAEIRALAAYSLAFTIDLHIKDEAQREDALKFAKLAAESAPDVMLGREPLATAAKLLEEKLTRSAVGCPAPELTGTDSEGKPFHLSDSVGRHVVVAFWNKQSDFFDTTTQTLKEISQKYAGAPLDVIAVRLGVGNDASSTHSHAVSAWKVIADSEDDRLKKAWHVTAAPTYILLDPKGRIIGRFMDVPAHTMFLNNSSGPMFSYSSSGSFGSNASAENSKTALLRSVEEIPAIAEPRRKLISLVTDRPWIVSPGWDGATSGERTVFFREDGSTSVKWIYHWEPRPPHGIHLHLLSRSTGCTDVDIDFETGEARVKSPAALASRMLRLRDFPFSGAPQTPAALSASECLLAHEWNWYAGSNPGSQPAFMKFRFKPEGATTSSMLSAWEVTPAGQVRVYLNDGRYWIFDFNQETKIARSNLADSQIKDHKAFSVGILKPNVTAVPIEKPNIIARPENATDAQVDLSKYYNGSFQSGWFPSNDWSKREDKILTQLKPGIVTMGDTVFDARGVIQVSSTRLRDTSDYPQQMLGIPIGAKVAQLHFLQACGWTAPAGTVIGHYLVHYADDTTEKIPLTYGKNIRDWVYNPKTMTEPAFTDATDVWKDTNAYVAKDGGHLRLAKFTWKNSKPDVEIRSIDLVSAMTDAAPFLMAITRD